MEGFVHLLSIIIIENFFHMIFHFIYQIIHEMLHLLIPHTAMFCKTKFITENTDQVENSFYFHSKVAVFQNVLVRARGNQNVTPCFLGCLNPD